MAPTKQPIGRLALRAEGEFWNAYHAQSHTMDGAIHLGSIRISAAQRNPQLKDRFMKLMQAVITEAIRETFDAPTSWGKPATAPESERAGHG
jgi:hypothetical protein